MTPPSDPQNDPPPRKLLRPTPEERAAERAAERPIRRAPAPAPNAAEDTLFAAPKYTPPPPRQRPIEPIPAAPPEEIVEEIVVEEESRGFGYIFSAIFMTIGLVLAASYGLREIIERGYLDQYKFVFQEVSLMPAKTIQPPSVDGSFQVFIPDDGFMLTISLQRLRRNMKAPEKDRLLIDTLFAPETYSSGTSLLPDGAAARGYYVVGRTGYLDVNEAFTQPNAASPRAERLAVYSIINSILLNNTELDAIQILVEGKPVETAWGWLDLSSPLGADLSLIR